MDSQKAIASDTTCLKRLLGEFKCYIEQVVLAFNSSQYDISLIHKYTIPYLVNERECNIDVKRTNAFVSLWFLNLKFLISSTFLGGATSLDSFLKANQTT